MPVSVSAFTEETILRQGITDLTDIGKFVPNLTVTGFSAGHVSSMNPFIRGIGLQDHLITTDPGVGVYVDGVYLGRQVGQNWSLANIERVEVLRGPQGTLYGRNTIGGAINIITRQPGEESGGRITAQAGSRGRLGGDFYWNQTFTDSFAASFTGAYTQRDGVGEFRNHDAARDVGELEEWNVRAAARWAPTEDFSILFTYDMADGEGGLRPYYTRIDEVPNGLLYATGARNSDTASDPYDNNGGFYIDPIIGTLVDRSVVTNEADGWAVTADWNMSDALAWKFIYSDRSSDYESGLDDDSLGSIANPARDSLGNCCFRARRTAPSLPTRRPATPTSNRPNCSCSAISVAGISSPACTSSKRRAAIARIPTSSSAGRACSSTSRKPRAGRCMATSAST